MCGTISVEAIRVILPMAIGINSYNLFYFKK